MKKTTDMPDVKVLKTATCPTLTGKSTLTYQIGLSPDSRIHLRISKNSGGGFFSDEWVSYDDIQAALENRHKESDITSYLLIPLFKGKSVNTPSFLLAVMKHLKLIRPLPGKQRLHVMLDPQPFLDQVNQLLSSGQVKSKSSSASATRKKAAAKKKTVSRRKTV